MPIKRDDFANEPPRGIVHMEASNFAQLYARRSGSGFDVGLFEDKYEWHFNPAAMRDAVAFFNRLLEIVDKD